MTTLELYTKGARVWVPHPETVWQPAELLEDFSPNKRALLIVTEENEKKTLDIKSEKDLPPLRNPAILIGGNDLTSLSYLHEPAVLYNLQARFCEQRNIYTYCGIILVAINPYDELPIYDIDTIQAYRGQNMGDLDPHIFAVAEEAFTKLEREQKNQSIIISGESGAGKTVSAKYTMRYFATVGGNATETHVEKKILASSPILEALGNAKTTRNDNSSRFGKFIELQFNDQYRISGASMRTYLLEKSRVVFQSEGERNYHIFYQLCAASEELEDLQLGPTENFYFLNQGSSAQIDGVDDYKKFQEMVDALKKAGFSEEEKTSIFRILAAVLHFGNLEFKEGTVSQDNEQDQEGCWVESDDPHLKILSRLLEVDPEGVRQWLCTRRIVSVREVFHKPMTLQDAQAARDALVKHIYAELFKWIVLILNYGIESDKSMHKFIGVLDIYGFETFEKNSFEQFCINYANEKLQQQFYLHVFKLEQEEYLKEDIGWTMIDFHDNQPCIDLIEVKLGVLDLLDEECRMPNGSDGSWTQKLYEKCSKYSQFGKAKFGKSVFFITHFADRVEYDSSGFLEKNRDTVLEEQINMVKKSRNKVVNRIFNQDAQKPTTPGIKVKLTVSKQPSGAQKTHKKTVGFQFKDSLNLLMSTLNSTIPYYIRCIKPNDNKSKFEYNPTRAAQQLKACGVLETIRLSAAGFPSRWTYQEFFQRYRVLCKFKDINRGNPKKTCECIIQQYIKNTDMYQFGRTKIFFRASQVAYMEKLRSDKLKRCCIMMQKTVRAFVGRKKFLRTKRSVMLLQRYGRGYLGRKLSNNIRRERAAIRTQKHIRGWLQRVKYQRLRKTILGIQTYARGRLARKKYLELKLNTKATIIQRHFRGYLGRKKAKREMDCVVICQAAIRRFLAKKQYKKLKIEARSIEHVKTLNKGLEMKIITLQQKIDELQKNCNAMEKSNNNYTKEVKELRNKMLNFKALEIEVKNLNNLLIDKNKNIEKIETRLQAEIDEKMDLMHNHQKVLEERKSETEERARLKEEIKKLSELTTSSKGDFDVQLKARVDEQKQLFMNEMEGDSQAYQKLLKEHHDLVKHCDQLEKELFVNGLSGKDHISIASSNVSALVESVQESDGQTEDDSSETSAKMTSNQVRNLNLLLTLQRKLQDVQQQKTVLLKRLDEVDSSPKVEEANKSIRDSLKISELEIQNSELKSQLNDLQDSINEGTAKSQLLKQLRNTQLELERKSEEIIQLKSVLANQTDNMKIFVNAEKRSSQYINEDGELALAYETQKTISKQLELELQNEKVNFKKFEAEYRAEIERLKEDNERQQRILASNLGNETSNGNEVYLKYEITRLLAENLQLHNKVDLSEASLRKLKKQNKYLVRALRDAGIPLTDFENEDDDLIDQKLNDKSLGPVVTLKRQGEEYSGMFAFESGDENDIMKELVLKLKPRTALTLLPCIPAYIVFMCIRYADSRNDENRVKSLISAFFKSVKKVMKERHQDLETATLWFANTLRLLQNMKQYSGEKIFQQKNTTKQNEKCLRNFDLSEYRQVLSDIAVWIYQGLIRNLMKQIQPLITPAILEYEEIQGISGNIPGGMRGRMSSVTKPDSPSQKPAVLLHELTSQYKILNYYGVDSEVISQIFRQLVYFLCATSLNSLLLRTELCHWSKGIQIRHNLSHLEMWIKDKELDQMCIQVLQPIIQATQLLQAKKENDDDVISICDMSTDLSGSQICKILNIYAPVDEFEERVSKSFIAKVKTELQRRSKQEEPHMMETNYQFPIRFPFNPSDICLENIEIPEVLPLLRFLQKQ